MFFDLAAMIVNRCRMAHLPARSTTPIRTRRLGVKQIYQRPGRKTLEIIRLADGIRERLAERTPLLRMELIAVLIELLAHVWRLKDLPAPIRNLMREWHMDYVERNALRALLERKLPASMRNAQAEEGAYTSGVPPPEIPVEVKG